MNNSDYSSIIKTLLLNSSNNYAPNSLSVEEQLLQSAGVDPVKAKVSLLGSQLQESQLETAGNIASNRAKILSDSARSHQSDSALIKQIMDNSTKSVDDRVNSSLESVVNRMTTKGTDENVGNYKGDATELMNKYLRYGIPPEIIAEAMKRSIEEPNWFSGWWNDTYSQIDETTLAKELAPYTGKNGAANLSQVLSEGIKEQKKVEDLNTKKAELRTAIKNFNSQAAAAQYQGLHPVYLNTLAGQIAKAQMELNKINDQLAFTTGQPQ